MKGVLSAIASAAFVLLYITQMCSATSGPMVSIEPSNIKVSHRENFMVNITMDPKGTEISGVDYILRFDNTLLNATSLIKGAFFDDFETMEFGKGIDNTLGKIDYGVSIWPVGDVGVTTRGTLTTITFQPISEHGSSELSFEAVRLSNASGYRISKVTINTATCNIKTIEQTPTPTSSTSTPSGGGYGGSNKGTSVTPTATCREDNSNGGTPITPTQTSTVTILSSASPSAAISPTATVSITPPPSEANKRLTGFEAVFAIVGLLVMSYRILKKNGGSNR